MSLKKGDAIVVMSAHSGRMLRGIVKAVEATGFLWRWRHRNKGKKPAPLWMPFSLEGTRWVRGSGEEARAALRVMQALAPTPFQFLPHQREALEEMQPKRMDQKWLLTGLVR